MKKILPKEIIDLYLNKLEFLDNSKILIYKYIDLKGGKDLIENLALKFSNPRGFNDPFDLYEGLIDFSKHETLPPSQMNRKERRKVQTASEKQKINYLKHEWRKLRSYFGISCFSKSHDDILMWAHYANKHSGLCIGFYVDVMTLLDQGFLTFEVEYENEFLPLPYSDPDLKIRINTIMQYLSVKSQYWSYEKEIRIIHFDYFKNFKDEFFPFNKYIEIHDVYFGLKMQEDEKLSIKRLLSSKRIKPTYYNMKVVKNKFAIESKQCTI